MSETVLHLLAFLGCLGTYLLIPWCGGLHEKLAGSLLVKKFPAFYGTQRFVPQPENAQCRGDREPLINVMFRDIVLDLTCIKFFTDKLLHLNLF